MHQRFSDERGFTLIELLVVILIIGILAAVALPNFISQRDRGYDSTAKANARNTVSHVEACYVNTQDYRGCTDEDALGKGLGITLGTGRNEVDVSASGAQSYTVVAKSPTDSTFTIKRVSSATPMERTCVVAEGKTTAGCKDGTW